MAAPTVTEQFVTYYHGLALADVPPTIREKTKALILDTLGCLRGGAHTVLGPKITAVSAMFGGPGKASMVGHAEEVGTAQALYVNTRLSNILDMDETFPMGTHFGIGAVCAAIAACEATAASQSKDTSTIGEELLISALAGYEAGARVATAIGPIFTVNDGKVQDYATTWGVAAPVVVAACVAYARALGKDKLDAETMEQALSIAISNIPMPIANAWTNSPNAADCKYEDAGWCAVTGMHGVVSAMAGLTGIDNVLDCGPGGFTDACAAIVPRPEAFLEELGQTWFIQDITFKPWPTCRWTHAPLTALDRILRHHNPAVEDIAQVDVWTNPVACGNQFVDVAPDTITGCAFSFYYAVSASLLRIPPGHLWFDKSPIETDRSKAARKLVHIQQLPGAELFAKTMVHNQIRTMPGAVTVKMKSGEEWTEQTDYSDGDPWDPETAFDQTKLEAKFRTVANSPHADEVIAWISGLETTKALGPLAAFLRGSL